MVIVIRRGPRTSVVSRSEGNTSTDNVSWCWFVLKAGSVAGIASAACSHAPWRSSRGRCPWRLGVLLLPRARRCCCCCCRPQGRRRRWRRRPAGGAASCTGDRTTNRCCCKEHPFAWQNLVLDGKGLTQRTIFEGHLCCLHKAVTSPEIGVILVAGKVGLPERICSLQGHVRHAISMLS